MDAYIIDMIKKEEERRRKESGRPAQIPLYIYPPGPNENGAPRKKRDTNKDGSEYTDVDYEIDLDVNKDVIIIEM